jgi:two-component system, chemotaxis family, response regulator Rcp1
MLATHSTPARPFEATKPMAQSSHGTPIEILLVEDNEDDYILTRDALMDGHIRNNLTRVKDGVEAMAYLHREGRFAQAARPDLILLDHHMPRKNGLQVLEEIKQDPRLRQIPVVMMTMSSDDHLILKAYDLQVNCYVTKPVDLDQFLSVVKSIEHFWFSVVKLPPAA